MHYAQVVLVCLRSVRMPLRNATGRGNLHNRPVIRPGTAHDLMKLPRRYRGHYVIYMNNAQFDSCVWDVTESCREWYELIRTRHDFLYANIDLGDHRACDDAPLPESRGARPARGGGAEGRGEPPRPGLPVARPRRGRRQPAVRMERGLRSFILSLTSST